MGVGNLAANPGNKEKIVEEGALAPLISLARFDNGDIDSQRCVVVNPLSSACLFRFGMWSTCPFAPLAPACTKLWHTSHPRAHSRGRVH